MWWNFKGGYDYFGYLVLVGLQLQGRGMVVDGGWLACTSTCDGTPVEARSSC